MRRLNFKKQFKAFSFNCNLLHTYRNYVNYLKNHQNKLVLGIETSCDDTSLALLTYPDGQLLGYSHISQHIFHSLTGGINPIFSRDLHDINIKKCVVDIQNILQNYNQLKNNYVFAWENILAIGVTTRPGLPLSLDVGIKCATELSKTNGSVPIIPIHHMEAHALSPLIKYPSFKNEKIDYPYLVLLVSGGHSLIVWVENSSKFNILGNCCDIAPGEAYDKIFRKLGLNYNTNYHGLNGGSAIEKLVENGEIVLKNLNFSKLENRIPFSHHPTCNFSFNGLLSSYIRVIELANLNNYNEHMGHKDIITQDANAKLTNNIHRQIHDIGHNCTIDFHAYDLPFLNSIQDLKKSLIASYFQSSLVDQLVQKTKRAMLYCERNFLEHLGKGKSFTLALAGGVASNNQLRNKFRIISQLWGWKLVVPPKFLCTDNGIMVAWNTCEKLKALGLAAPENFCEIIEKSPQIELKPQNRCDFGISLLQDIKDSHILNKDIKAHENNKEFFI